MAKHLHDESYIDHFLQADILGTLSAADEPVRFSDLKQDGIDNSLFMYHVNKLINRGLVAKTDAGFRLTLKGARWANYAGIFHNFSVATPRLLIQCIIQDGSHNTLLAMRRGQLRQQLNDYLLPGNIYRYGLTLEENVATVLGEIFGDAHLPPAMPLATADIIHQFEDGFVHHVVSHIFMLSLPGSAPQLLEHPLFAATWVPTGDIQASNPAFERSAFLPQLFGRLGSIKPHEVFRLESK